MKPIIALLFFLLPEILIAQNKLTITESTLKIAAMSEEVFYFGFDEGDQLILSFDSKKELKEIQIFDYVSSSILYSDYKSTSINNKTIQILRTGIYGFRFSNEAITGRVCNFKIERQPKEGGNFSFNSTVFWRSMSDTTYYTEKEQFIEGKDTSFIRLINQNAKVSSKNAINGNNNKNLIDFTLPANTVSWSYYIGVGSEGKRAYDAAQTKFLDAVSGIASEYGGYYGALTALALNGYSYFKKVQGEDNVKYYFITDYDNVLLFWNDQTFYQYKQGDVTNDASQMKAPLSGKIYLGLSNDNVVDPIDVLVEVTAMVVKNRMATKDVQKMHIKTWKEPYLKQ